MATTTAKRPRVKVTAKKATPTKVSTKGSVGTASSVGTISTAVWAADLLQTLNAPVTKNNIANIQRWIEVESAGNQAGFLRDNNPLNLNTYTSAHGSLAGGKIVHEFGIYVQTFASVQEGVRATAAQIRDDPTLLAAFKKSVPASMFGGALATSAWKSGSYANATAFAKITPYTGESAVNSLGPIGTGFSVGKGIDAVTNVADSTRHDTAATLDSAASDAASVGTLIGDITDPSKLKNVGIFVGGVVIAGIGLVLFVSTTKPGQESASVGESVAKVAA